MRLLVSMLLLLSGCLTTGRALPVQVIVDTHPALAPDTQLLLDEASAILGVPLVDSPRSGIVLELVDGRGFVMGRAFRSRACLWHVRSTYSPQVIAHEIGHVLGLPHHPDRFNLMWKHASADTMEVTDRQWVKAMRRMAWIRDLCP